MNKLIRITQILEVRGRRDCCPPYYPFEVNIFSPAVPMQFLKPYKERQFLEK
jgi:hypothetical protein